MPRFLRLFGVDFKHLGKFMSCGLTAVVAIVIKLEDRKSMLVNRILTSYDLLTALDPLVLMGHTY